VVTLLDGWSAPVQPPADDLSYLARRQEVVTLLDGWSAPAQPPADDLSYLARRQEVVTLIVWLVCSSAASS
jgi:hypothetical protein